MRRKPETPIEILVAGLPDMGNVAGLTLRHLVEQTKPDLCAEILPFWPPWVEHRAGSFELSRPAYQLWCKSQPAIAFFTGPFQPNFPFRLYELCYLVANLARDYGVRRVYTIGGSFGSGQAGVTVHGVTNRPEVFEELRGQGVTVLPGEGRITGFNGLLLGIAAERGLEAVCLLAEVANPEIPQPRSARRILEILGQVLTLTLDLTKLDAEEKELSAMLRARVEGEETRERPRGPLPGVA